MGKRSGIGLLFVCLLVVLPSWAAKEIIVDFDTGKETEWVDEAPPAPERTEAVDAAELRRELARLRKVLRFQQHLINQQQTAIKALKTDLRRQQNINRGLERLCRACR
jgi:hypothetical protein